MATRGSITIGGSNYVLSIQQETQLITSGMMNLNIPTASSDKNTSGAVKGRVRTIALEGQYAGTQLQIEVFITTMESWVNANASLQDVALYYPLHHKNGSGDSYSGTPNTSGQQKYYYEVMAVDFQFVYDEREASRIKFTINLLEGSKTGWIKAIAGG